MTSASARLPNPAVAGKALPHDRTRELLGQVMGLVAVAVGFAARCTG